MLIYEVSFCNDNHWKAERMEKSFYRGRRERIQNEGNDSIENVC